MVRHENSVCGGGPGVKEIKMFSKNYFFATAVDDLI